MSRMGAFGDFMKFNQSSIQAMKGEPAKPKSPESQVFYSSIGSLLKDHPDLVPQKAKHEAKQMARSQRPKR
jgi:hypothetical protein